MSLVSNTFLLFIAAAVLVYYLAPPNVRWIVLLAFSYLYYIAGGAKYLFFILFSTAVTYGFARLLDRKDGEEASGAKRKRIAGLGLVCNFGMLGIVKYTNFFVENINTLFHTQIPGLALLFPLGISFYTFQSSGYLLDVYWDRVKAEKNFFRYALFVSFFPQLLQGPIGRYQLLADQLYEPHAFDWKSIYRGLERILWGFAKKMILADWAAVFADAIWSDPQKYKGLAIFGTLLYGIQLYADFSGGMDVVIGLSEMFGITLQENFKRPYFATSITDYWHRWHITLGTWMKDYVFYPVTLSGWMSSFGKWAKKKFGRKTGRTLPICVANIIVFLVVGIWHGAAWKYIVYGFYNGLIIAFSGLMAERYKKWKKACHISGTEGWYHVFMILRTFLLVDISLYFDRAESVGQALQMLKYSVTSFQPQMLLRIPAGREGTAFAPYALAIIAAGCVVLFITGVLQERGMVVREALEKLPLPITAAVWLCLLLSIGFFGSTAVAKGFIYAQF